MDALISGRAGVAVLFDGSRIASIRADDPERVLPCREAELPHLLRQAEDFEIVEDLPQGEIVDRLLQERQRALALQLALYVIDPKLEETTRREAAEALSGLMVSEETRARLEEVLYAHLTPEEADLEGAIAVCKEIGAALVLDVVERLRDLQPFIEEVRKAWDAIPRSDFTDDDELRRWQATAVRLGLFRRLVLHLRRASEPQLLLLEWLSQRDVVSLPKSRLVLPHWIRFLAPPSEILEQSEAEEEIDEPRPKGRRDRRGKKKRGSRLTFERIDRQKGAIIAAMEKGDLSKVREFVEDLLDVHAHHGGPKYAVKSLCDLAMNAKRLGYVTLQLELTERSLKVRPEDGWAWAQYADALLQNHREQERHSVDSTRHSKPTTRPPGNILKTSWRRPDGLRSSRHSVDSTRHSKPTTRL